MTTTEMNKNDFMSKERIAQAINWLSNVGDQESVTITDVEMSKNLWKRAGSDSDEKTEEGCFVNI